MDIFISFWHLKRKGFRFIYIDHESLSLQLSTHCLELFAYHCNYQQKGLHHRCIQDTMLWTDLCIFGNDRYTLSHSTAQLNIVVERSNLNGHLFLRQKNLSPHVHRFVPIYVYKMLLSNDLFMNTFQSNDLWNNASLCKAPIYQLNQKQSKIFEINDGRLLIFEAIFQNPS